MPKSLKRRETRDERRENFNTTIMELSYKEAITEIEAILRSLREEQNSVDTLAERVARATELIALCRTKLRKAESDVAKVLEE